MHSGCLHTLLLELTLADVPAYRLTQMRVAPSGRIQTVLAMRVAGALCLLVIGMHRALWTFSSAMIPIVLLRTGTPVARGTRARQVRPM